MTDIYVKSTDQRALESFLSNFVNTLPIGSNNQGAYYSCVRINGDSILSVDGTTIILSSSGEAAPIVGVFA